MIDNFSKKIIQETFESSFNKEKFTNFIKNLLNHFDDSEEAKFIYRGQTIPEVYQDKILSLNRIGKYIDPEGKKIDILIVNLKNIKSLDRARTLQRNFIAWYLDGSRGGILKDAALVAFISPDSDSWRFSLVKMDYKIQDAKVKKDLTPAKRYSFLVGSQEKSHTAQSRLVPIIEDDKNNPSLKQIEEAFNIEKVTKEFFEKYRNLFVRLKESLDDVVSKNNKIKENFEKKNIETSGFAKKLLGQIVFLYFLQKKGWFGVERDSDWGTGPKNFLRELFDSKKISYKNFFNDILEPLFYEALAKKRDNDFYSRLNCKIPFLNGGLFDPLNDYDWVFTDINIDNELFSNSYKTKEGDIGSGILDVFDRYNFTVREDEPLEKEVAVDPEMLGKVFENLLEVKDRKSKGTYYTPREIVHYMCQESLINYLYSELNDQVSKEDLEILVKKGNSFIHNDQSASLGIKKYEEQIPQTIKIFAPLIDIKLADIKVCDPAVGSGAFLVGMMTEIINVREVLSYLFSNVEEKDIYKFKRWSIQHSLYGVDIDPSAVEVAKLRLWLSLVVEEDDIKKIKPLPNLDYKIMQGNSLLEEFKGVKIFDEKLLTKNKGDEHDYVAELKQKELELGGKLLPFYQKNPRLMSNKSISRPTELAELEMEISKVQSSLKKNTTSLKTQIIKPLQIGLSFLDIGSREDVWLRLKKLYSRYFKSYDSDQKRQIRNNIEKVIWELIETTLKEEGKLDTLKEIEIYKNNGIRPFFLWKLYFADVFQEKGGFDVVIANPPYIDSESMVKNGQGDIREMIQKKYKYTKGNWDIYIAFFELSFLISKENGNMTFITPDKWIAKPFGFELRKGTLKYFVSLVNTGRKIFENAKVDSILSFFSKQIKGDTLNVIKYKEQNFELIRIIDKKTINDPYALDYLFSNRLDFVLSVDKNKYQLSKYGLCENACATSDAYKLSPIVENATFSGNSVLYKKIVNTGTISKYYSRWGFKEMTYLKHKYLFPVVSNVNFNDLFKNSYQTKSNLPKIIIKGLNLLDAFLDEKGEYIPGKSTMIVTSKHTENLKLLLAIINSKLMIFYIKEKYPSSSYNQGIGFTKDMINYFPIPDIKIETFNEIIKVVDKIIDITKNDTYFVDVGLHAQVYELEKQIDQMVYKLYRLTEEEIKIVEESIKK